MTKDEILESMDKDINSAGLDLYLAHFHKDSHAVAGFTQRESILFQAMVITLAFQSDFE